MKFNAGFTCIILTFLLIACSKNQTSFYKDVEDPGLAIFSNTQNNIMTCYANGRAWRTGNRIAYSGWGGGTIYEIYINKNTTTSLYDTIVIAWDGNWESSTNSDSRISLTLPIAKSFPKSFNELEGKRLVFDTTQGFYSTSMGVFNGQTNKGWGSIYFQNAHIESVGPNNFRGKMAGLFEAHFSTDEITRGRFDHSINDGNLIIY